MTLEERFKYQLKMFTEFYVTQTIPDWVHILCTRSGVHIVYPIGYIKGVPDRVLSLNLLSAEPMPYKARLGARFVYPIGYSVYVPDQVHISVYPPYSEGLLEFCDQDHEQTKCKDLHFLRKIIHQTLSSTLEQVLKLWVCPRYIKFNRSECNNFVSTRTIF